MQFGGWLSVMIAIEVLGPQHFVWNENNVIWSVEELGLAENADVPWQILCQL